MYQVPLPQFIEQMTDDEISSYIISLKRQMRDQILILGHHYQRDEVIIHCDERGDSLKLAKIARAQKNKPYIIFCGVHFMAETADMLTSDDQQVSLPDMRAGCDMADMAEIKDVEQAWKDITQNGLSHIIPITYVNSSAALKAFVGRHGGVICTSSNADKIVTWALEHGQHVFFFPDQHLGRNICKKLGLSPQHDMLLWDPEHKFGGHTLETIKQKKVWLWQGHCPVHAMFTVEQVKRLRRDSPQTRIIVHPEVAMEVADLADDMGSTEYIIRAVESAKLTSSWAIGTEKHLVERLAKENPDKHIISLNQFSCLCATMNRISAKHLAWVLDGLKTNNQLLNRITVPKHISRDALLALERMFQLT